MNAKPTLNYLKCDSILEIQSNFSCFLNEHRLDVELTPMSTIRESLFHFFNSDGFRNNYFKLALTACKHVAIEPDDCVLQMSPTPRIFRPGAIGTSYHCDYWYGHGKTAYTIWVPLTGVDEHNTFYSCDPKAHSNLYMELEVSPEKIARLNEQLILVSAPVLPGNGEAYLFPSTLMHGSPQNKSSKTRISFDFRISTNNDSTSTKDLNGYYHHKSNSFYLTRHQFEGRRVLKYVCGGKFKNTFIQHVIIEASAKRYNFELLEQEAEIERHGYPVLESYLEPNDSLVEIDGIVIASSSIVSGILPKLINDAKIRVWCALENEFLDKILQS
jgi:ectoine hydroxylase-related dioxygenase (phytanoyl-CoA dioxygenase family)